MSKLNVLDLFCGAGGMSTGFSDAGFKIIAGIDNWKDALVTFKYNHPSSKVLNADLSAFNLHLLADEIDQDISVIIGGPPCQGFSISGKRDPNDPKNNLYQGFVRAVELIKPSVFVLENVPNLIAMNNGTIKNSILSDFSKLDYSVKYKILLASDFGVPQYRRRVFFIGYKGYSKFEFPELTISGKDRITCIDALSDLPEDSLVDGAEYPISPQSKYQEMMRYKSKCVYNHQITNHNSKTVKIISLVPDGGNYKDLPEEYRYTRKVNIAWTRYASNKPSYTIDTGHRHHFHYNFDRVPTVRESARLQSFSDDYIFLGSKTSQHRQVGNAVPPILAKVIAKKVLEFL